MSIDLYQIVGFIIWSFLQVRLVRQFGSTLGTARVIIFAGVKYSSSILLGVVYLYYYQEGDMQAYYKDAVALRELAISTPSTYFSYLFGSIGPDALPETLSFGSGSPRAAFFSKLVSIVNLLAANSFWLLTLFFGYFSLFATFLLATSISRLVTYRYPLILISLFLIPESVFWTSGMLKESLSFAFICLIMYSYLEGWVFKKRPLLSFLLFIGSSFFLWQLKYHIAAILLPLLLSVLITDYLKNRFSFHRQTVFWGWIILISLLLLMSTGTYINLHVNNLPLIISNSYYEYAEKSEGSHYIHYSHLEPSFRSIALYSPQALVGAWFRPWIGDSEKIIQFPLVLQNVLLSFLFITSLPCIIKRLLRLNIIYWASWGYCLLLGVFTALSVPNFGTLSRFRSAWLCIFVFLILQDNPYVRKAIKHMIKKRKDG